MLLVEVDIVRPQPLEAVFAGLPDIGRRGAGLGARIVHGHGELGREDDVLAPGPEDLAKLGFRAAPVAVYVGGVEQRDTQLNCPIDDPLGSFDRQRAEIIASQSNDRDFNSRLSEFAFFHRAASS